MNSDKCTEGESDPRLRLFGATDNEKERLYENCDA
jgi:hypothetical protein